VFSSVSVLGSAREHRPAFYVQIDCATIVILLTQISFFLIFLRTAAGLMLLLLHQMLALTGFYSQSKSQDLLVVIPAFGSLVHCE
jgi:hypothetical protein